MNTRDDSIAVELIKHRDKTDVSNFTQKEYLITVVSVTSLFNFKRKCLQYATLHCRKRAKISRRNNIIEIANGFFLTEPFFILQPLRLIKTNPNHQLDKFQTAFIAKKEVQLPKLIRYGYESQFRNLIIGEMAATSRNYAQEYKHKITDTCMNKKGTTTLLRCNIKGNNFLQEQKNSRIFYLEVPQQSQQTIWSNLQSSSRVIQLNSSSH